MGNVLYLNYFFHHMSESDMFDEQEMKKITNILDIATRRSAESISMMIDMEVEHEMKALEGMDGLNKMVDKLDIEDMGLLTFSKLGEEEDGITVFILMEETARDVVNILLYDEGETFGSFGEMEMSALKEVGNIVIGNFLGEISNHLGISIMHTPPELTHDMVGGFLNYMIGYTSTQQETLMTEVTFTVKGKGFEGKYILTPGTQLMEKITKSLKK